MFLKISRKNNGRIVYEVAVIPVQTNEGMTTVNFATLFSFCSQKYKRAKQKKYQTQNTISGMASPIPNK